ncbi:MAG: hypothetical protein HY306_04915 [Nitrosomonadales bacterium]|nr:hypothetical protein [Nitrosomonadales bacterium]
MSRDTDNQTILQQQLAHDTRMRVIDRMHDLISNGAKGLAVLNGGAVVAMLAFVQALVEKPVYRCFKPYAVGGLACFLVGAFVATIAFFAQHTYVNHAFKDTGKQMLWRRIVWGALIASATAAAIGGTLVTVGIGLEV